eukprot:tig00021796_g23558.t1
MYNKWMHERRQREAEERAAAEARERRRQEYKAFLRDELADRFRSRVEDWLDKPGEVEAVERPVGVSDYNPRGVEKGGRYFGVRNYVPEKRRVAEAERAGPPYLRQPPYNDPQYPFRERVKSREGPVWRHGFRTETERVNEAIAGTRPLPGVTGKATEFVVRRMETAPTAGAFLSLDEPYGDHPDPRATALAPFRARHKAAEIAGPFHSSFPPDRDLGRVALPVLPAAGASPRGKQYFSDARAIANRSIDAGDLDVGALPAEEKVERSRQILRARYH